MCVCLNDNTCQNIVEEVESCVELVFFKAGRLPFLVL